MTTIGTSDAQRLGQLLLSVLLVHRGWVSDYYWTFLRTEAGSVTTVGTFGAQRLCQ